MLKTIKSLAKDAFIIAFLKTTIPIKVIKADIIDSTEKTLIKSENINLKPIKPAPG